MQRRYDMHISNTAHLILDDAHHRPAVFYHCDVLLLYQFLSSEDYIISSCYTKICPKLQKQVASSMLKHSRKIGMS